MSVLQVSRKSMFCWWVVFYLLWGAAPGHAQAAEAGRGCEHLRVGGDAEVRWELEITPSGARCVGLLWTEGGWLIIEVTVEGEGRGGSAGVKEPDEDEPEPDSGGRRGA